MIWIALVMAVCLAGGHLFAAKLRFMSAVPRSRWLSAAGGLSVAYVFVHLLPELHKGQVTLERYSGETAFRFLEAHAYLVALIGLAVFYGLERLARISKEHSAGGHETTSAGVFWLHMSSFGVYNALIGYLLLHREVKGLTSLLLYAFAMGLHFLVNDYGLYWHHKERYRRWGRWLLTLSILLGWAVGTQLQLHAAALAILFAFLAGGVVINVLKEELPETQGSRFWPFATGAFFYAALLIGVGIVSRG